MKLSDYILQSREVRIAHIDLSTPCDFRRRKNKAQKQTIVDFLGVENDVTNWVDAGINRCHLCEYDTPHGNCSNPLHQYLGTVKENANDHRAANPDYVSPLDGNKAIYVNEQGETELLPCEEARARGLKGATAGKAVFVDPESGTTMSLTVTEGKERGWIGTNTGKANYLNPESGEVEQLTTEEAKIRGWRGVNAGKASYVNPDTGKVEHLAVEEGEARGWQGVTTGRALYVDPDTGETVFISVEEAKEKGWKGANAGYALFRNPETGEVVRLPVAEGKERGWQGNRSGQPCPKRTCPHCGALVGTGNYSRWHGDNCAQREGSWRWFKAQLKQWELNKDSFGRGGAGGRSELFICQSLDRHP